MKARGSKLYWRPTRVPGRALFLLSSAAVVALLLVENFTERTASIAYDKMLSASRLTQESIEKLRPIRGGIVPINPGLDPHRSGMIGLATSSITSNSGDLQAKQATVNPNWAALAVRLLVEAGVQPGDHVAVAVSGSFPALNLAVYAALQVLDVEATIIVSGSASQWGANVPAHGWMDMARALRDARLLDLKAAAATLGGIGDRGIGIDEEGLAAIRLSAERAGIPVLLPENYEASVAERVRIYEEGAAGAPIVALINVGGGTATTGPNIVDHYFQSGLQNSAPSRAFRVPSVMGYFLQREIPVINFSGIRRLATRYGLPYPPLQPESVGAGGVYRSETYQRWLAGLMMAVLVGLTGLIMRSANIALAASPSHGHNGSIRPKV
jgi:poly-gamma-glutamate system protein